MLHLRIHGRVQGVWFRESARRKAEQLGVRGVARNEPDGTVTIEAEAADPATLTEFVKWCHQGPPLARVDKVEQTTVEPRGYTRFEVVR